MAHSYVFLLNRNANRNSCSYLLATLPVHTVWFIQIFNNHFYFCNQVKQTRLKYVHWSLLFPSATCLEIFFVQSSCACFCNAVILQFCKQAIHYFFREKAISRLYSFCLSTMLNSIFNIGLNKQRRDLCVFNINLFITAI
jgi:hypothetical protein